MTELTPQEREPSLEEKLVNFQEFLAEITPEKAQEIMERLKEEGEWKSTWTGSFCINCALPLIKEEMDILKSLADSKGEVVLSPGFRRSGKTTSLQMLRLFANFFSTPERLFPKTHYLECQGLDFVNHCENPEEPEPEEIEKVILENSSLSIDFRSDPKTPTAHLEKAKCELANMEIILIDEILDPSPLKKGQNLLEFLKSIRRLCPKALIFTTNGHSLKSAPLAKEIFLTLYESNMTEEQPLKIYERGLSDSWPFETALINFIGNELQREGLDVENQDHEVIKLWILNRIFLFKYCLGNPFTVDQFFKFELDSLREEFLENKSSSSELAGFERMINDIIQTPVHRSVRNVSKPFGLPEEEIKTIANKYEFVNPDSLKKLIKHLNDSAVDLYIKGIESVYSPKAILEKYQRAIFNNAQVATKQMATILSPKSGGPSNVREVLETCRREFALVDYSLMAKALSDKYPDALI